MTETSLRWPVVLFDLDGTLADTIPLIMASYHHALETVMGLRLEEPLVRSWIGRPLLPVLEEEFPGHAQSIYTAYREWNLANHDALIRPVDGMSDLVGELSTAGAELGVVTSKLGATALLGLQAVGLDRWVTVLAGQEHTSRHKPEPDPLLHAAAQLGAAPGDCVYVGDAVVDVQAAHAAGMSAVAVTWGAGTTEALSAAEPVAVVDDVTELLSMLRPPLKV